MTQRSPVRPRGSAPSRGVGGRGAALALALALAVPACARQGAPPGGPTDRRAPQVVATDPDTFARIEARRDPVRIQFNERISERPARGTLDDAVVVSPRTGEVRVTHARDALEVGISGGFRPGLVYRITLQPVVQDMFSNTMGEPFEFVFSTGAPFTPNVAAGLVIDRTTGEGVEGYEVRVRSDAGGDEPPVTHVAVTDTGGFFALRYLPPGRYDLLAFQDLNRNAEVDFSEARGERSLLFREADTLIVEIPVLRPDTSRAVLGRAVPVSPRSIRLEFDDFLNPASSPAGVTVSLAPDSAASPGAAAPPAVERTLHEPAWEAWRDSLAAAQGGEAEAAPRERRLPAPGRVPTTPGQERGGLGEGPLPSRSLYVVLAAPLPPNVPYRLTVSGVVNLNDLPFGGGSAVVVRQPEAADTAAAAADTAGAPAADSVPGVAPDTVPSVPVVPVDTVPATVAMVFAVPGPVDIVAAASVDTVQAVPPDPVGAPTADPGAAAPGDALSGTPLWGGAARGAAPVPGRPPSRGAPRLPPSP